MPGDKADIDNALMFRVWAAGALLGALVGFTFLFLLPPGANPIARGIMILCISTLGGFVFAVPIGALIASPELRPLVLPTAAVGAGLTGFLLFVGLSWFAPALSAGLVWLFAIFAIGVADRLSPIPDQCGKCGYSLAGLEGSTCPECGAEFRRVRRTRCTKCGYSLESLTSGVCPECGKPFEPDVKLGI